MAPGSLSSASSSSTAGSSGCPGSDQRGLSHDGVLSKRRNPPMLRMVLEALQAGERRRGTSVAAIKLYILQKYPAVDAARFKYLLKQALDTGVRRGLLARPANSKAKGATGSFKLVTKRKRRIQPRKTLPLEAPRRAGEAKGKGPKKLREPRTDPANMGDGEKAARRLGEAKKALPRPGAAREKAPTGGSEARVVGARTGEARKAPLKPNKATQAPSSASGLSRKSKVKGSSSRQGAAEAHRKAKAEGERSKPAATKVRSGASSPTKRKRTAGVPTGAAAQGTRAGPRTKAAAPPKGGRPKAQPALVAWKTQAPEGPRRPAPPAQSLSHTAASRKAEAGG